MKAHVSEAKKEEVAEIKKSIEKYKIIAIIDLTNMPSPQLQKMRKQLEDTLIKVTKKRLLKIIFTDLNDKRNGIEKLNESMKNSMPCLLLTNQGSFKLSRLIKKSKSKVAAKPGQIAPEDITVNAGPTPFTPGPIIGELGALGIKATVEEGKIVIKEDCLLVKKDEEINAKQADLLSKLSIEPIEIGLNLIATFENGTIFNKEVLDIDEDYYPNTITQNASDSFKLAISIGYLTKNTTEYLIKKAESESKALSESLELPGSTKFNQKLATAEAQAKNLKSNIKEDSSMKTVIKEGSGEDERKEKVKNLIKEQEKEEEIRKTTSEDMLKEVPKEEK